MATALTLGGKKANKIQKTLAIASAVVSGGVAAVDAFKAGMSIGGPFAPIAAASYAAASIAQTSNMISSIRSGSKPSAGGGGGGGASASTSGGGGGGGQSDNAPESRNISINLTGEGLMSTDQVRALIGQINESVGDGVQLITSGES